jgi:alcohol dehydrogenase
MLIGSPNIMPRVALVDPLMTLQMPQGITTATGLDALTHAIEAYVSVKAHQITDTLALGAIRLTPGICDRHGQMEETSRPGRI